MHFERLLAHQQGSSIWSHQFPTGAGGGEVRGQVLQRWRAATSPEIYGAEAERRAELRHWKMMLT